VFRFLTIFALLCATVFAPHFSTPRAFATTAEHGPSPEITPEQGPPLYEMARLRIHNVAGGEIAGSRDKGQTWELIGRVAQPTMKVNPRGYNASKYADIGSVSATAVNAIHLKAGYNAKENRGIIWSLSPRAETAAGSASLQSEVSPGSSAFTDIPGGSGIFGGPFTPFVGNPIFLDNDKNNELKPLPENYVPKLGDVWTILVQRPAKYPREIVFENRFGGLITLQYRDEKPRVIGQVLRPVQGVGRFVGSYFSGVGRLRANHNGVIDVSTSPVGKIGSFQIVPANHAMSPETHYIRELTQWMVVGPVSALDPSWEGVAPLYSNFLRPRYDRNDVWNNDWIEGLAGRFRFEVKLADKKGKISDWQQMPDLHMNDAKTLPTWAGTALANMTHLRIAFPFVWDETANATTTGGPTTSATVPVATSATPASSATAATN
jgi:hypothetical protein